MTYYFISEEDSADPNEHYLYTDLEECKRNAQELENEDSHDVIKIFKVEVTDIA
jgi:hypothetical protein